VGETRRHTAVCRRG